MTIENAVVVKSKTRLELLVERFNTRQQGKFYIERAGGSFADYEAEHDTYYASLDEVQSNLSRVIKTRTIERSFVPTYLFSERDIVVVVGQDGLVANTAKYVGGVPIIAINPDINRYDGVLLPFTPKNCTKALENVVSGRRYHFRDVTMAEAKLNDGQRLLAFNDLFVGAASHVSARYGISHRGIRQDHSSSGVIVSTAAGATGWLSSIFNMTQEIVNTFYGEVSFTAKRLDWSADMLVYVVREPFLSKTSQTSLIAGEIIENEPLIIQSHMPANGVIFSDGIESDFVKFNSGASVTIATASRKARLVMPYPR
ncbi:sugar kinase [Candidatus Magnetobacterium bavaricum]|uniref:Sugar kinase n=1 Tax=Candidatus Magnetobacterium bavaricum TaxID=29290 RepID=A0A0F3GTT0_9BACT|nr:sugar kinase [Candidatus Magnetobacterium bavaricum]